MLYKEYVIIQGIEVHHVSNRMSQDGVVLSNHPLVLSDDVRKILVTYFLTSFNTKEYCNLFHESDIKLNEVYSYVTKVFEDPGCLHEQSINLAKHLYEKSNHPKIKGGEFYVVYFKDCILDGETIDAVGLFKSENKDTFLKVYPSGDGFEIESQQGININKLDKGCLIFNTEKDKGYIVSVVDNTNKTEAQYWIDEFLHVRQRQDEYFHTQNTLAMYKNFVTKELPSQFEVTRADQADLLNKSIQFFKEKDNFDMDDFANVVIDQPEVADSFNQFKERYQNERDIQIADNFTISESAVKKQTRSFKSVIKLDKNFHIYVHGNHQYIKKGYDESTGLYYYQLFFKEEL